MAKKKYYPINRKNRFCSIHLFNYTVIIKTEKEYFKCHVSFFLLNLWYETIEYFEYQSRWLHSNTLKVYGFNTLLNKKTVLVYLQIVKWLCNICTNSKYWETGRSFFFFKVLPRFTMFSTSRPMNYIIMGPG